MKTYLLLLAGLLVGGVVAFLTFAILFNAPLAKSLFALLLPVALAAVVSLVLVWIEPRKWKLVATSVALPMLLMSAFLLIMLWAEGRYDLGWISVAVASICACVIPAWFALALKVRGLSHRLNWPR